MTLVNQDFASPFLSPRAADVAAEDPPRPFDDSAEGMRRLRDPFAVDPAEQPDATTTDDRPSGS